VDTISLVDLGPVIAAVLGPMLAFVAVSMRYQHVDGTKTRKLITDSEKEARGLVAGAREETRELIANSKEETRALIEQSNKATLEAARELIDGIANGLAEHRRETRESFREVNGSLADTRERLARIEGHLGIGIPLPRPDGNAADAA
jgi:vacuolar-type H+-ATPase subunit H